jgi:hypothetical protein
LPRCSNSPRRRRRRSQSSPTRWTGFSAALRSITQDEYDKKALELKDRQAELAARISQHQSGNEEFRTTLETLISVASRAVELFERSKIEQKRQLIALVFSNLKLRGKKL